MTLYTTGTHGRTSVVIFVFIASVHAFMYETSDFFYSIITFSYAKYFVQSYTVDVVFTLSY